MGKFTGVLIASDFDNTLIYTENALKGLEPMPELLPENREAIEYFMAQGGTFSIATGAALLQRSAAGSAHERPHHSVQRRGHL